MTANEIMYNKNFEGPKSIKKYLAKASQSEHFLWGGYIENTP